MHAVSRLRIEQILNPRGLDWQTTEVQAAGVKRITLEQIIHPEASPAQVPPPLVVAKQFTVEQIISPRGAALPSEEPRRSASRRFTIAQIIAPAGPASSHPDAVVLPLVTEESVNPLPDVIAIE